MANVQVEDGHLKIADALVVAVCREDFTAAQLRILFAIMSMTYRVGKTKAAISSDDLRYATGEKRYTIQGAMGGLIDRRVVFVQHLTNGERLVGIQKDYERWLPKIGKSINSGYYLDVNTSITTRRDLPKIGNKESPTGNKKVTPPGKILTWMLDELHIDLKVPAWRKEYGQMIKVYIEALAVAHEPKEAMRAIRDYFDYLDNPDFRARVTRPASYMLAGFKSWYRQLPKKTREVAEIEQITGYRHRYNLKTKHWEKTNDRIN